MINTKKNVILRQEPFDFGQRQNLSAHVNWATPLNSGDRLALVAVTFLLENNDIFYEYK
jgi:hypothetical protein